MKTLTLILILFFQFSVVSAEEKVCSIENQKKGFCGSCDEVAHTANLCEYNFAYNINVCPIEKQKKGLCGSCDEVENTAGLCKYN